MGVAASELLLNKIDHIPAEQAGRLQMQYVKMTEHRNHAASLVLYTTLVSRLQKAARQSSF